MKAVVTGHTRGIGAAIAAQLLSRNIRVMGIARAKNEALEKRFPNLLAQIELDFADGASLAGWLGGDDLRQFLADCDTALLVNNAGMVQPVGPLATQDPGMVARAVALNVAAPMMLSSAMIAASQNARERRIVHISSGAGRNAYPGWSVYCATKAALDHHARAVALDKTPALRICSLAPGVIDTDMQAEIRATPLERFPIRERFDQLKRNGELTSPQDCAARLVDYVLSERFGHDPVADLRD